MPAPLGLSALRLHTPRFFLSVALGSPFGSGRPVHQRSSRSCRARRCPEGADQPEWMEGAGGVWKFGMQEDRAVAGNARFPHPPAALSMAS